MTPLEALLKERIKKSGPIDVAAFMDLALSHPDHGYYRTRDPLGGGGDFTTSPEISQIFGELLGAWAADLWLRAGRPSSFSLLECGPGRGTLISDALRATRNIEGFHKALTVFMLETSPVLIKKQKERLADYKNIEWIEALDCQNITSASGPVVFLANEFLDALPARQLIAHKGKWYERMVTVEASGKLTFSRSPYVFDGPVPVRGQESDIYEFSPAREAFVADVCDILKDRGGAALFIDYGHEGPAIGDTLQAVKSHEYVPVLSNVGEADMTSHVDFAPLADRAKDIGVEAAPVIEQGLFLNSLGIQVRVQTLLRHAPADKKEEILKAVNRLTAPDQMGRLFKVLALHSWPVDAKERR